MPSPNYKCPNCKSANTSFCSSEEREEGEHVITRYCANCRTFIEYLYQFKEARYMENGDYRSFNAFDKEFESSSL